MAADLHPVHALLYALAPETGERLSADDIASGVRRRILSGKIPVGEVLPSIRALASGLGVAPNTVVKAYQTLVGEGFICKPHFRRYRYIVTHNNSAINKARIQVLRSLVRDFISTVHARGFSRDEIHAMLEEQWTKK